MRVAAAQKRSFAADVNAAAGRKTLASTKGHLESGDVTPTDVAQAEARLRRGLADLQAAEAYPAISQATYAQMTGASPGRLAPSGTMRLSRPFSGWGPS